MKNLLVLATTLATVFGQIDVQVEDRGCWPVDALRELTIWEGRDPILNGLPSRRRDAIQKCAKVAQKHGFRFFAIIEGACHTGPLVELKLTPLWPCNAERMHLYQVNTIVDAKFLPLGCRQIPHVQEEWIDLGELFERTPVKWVWKNRQEALKRCARAAAVAGYQIFGFYRGTACKAWTRDVEEARLHPMWSNCSTLGDSPDKSLRGDIPELFHLTKVATIELVNLGCWNRDDGEPVLPLLESRSQMLGEWDHKKRVGAVRRCAVYNYNKGHEIFALTDGGACAGTPVPRPLFKELGRSEDCTLDGRGAERANQVYKIVHDIKEFKFEPLEMHKPLRVSSLGCWKVELDSLIPTLEGADENLLEEPDSRKEPIQKCALAAHRRGWDVFAIHEGKCLSARNARNLYSSYDHSEICDLKWGGRQSLSVWEINIVRDPHFSSEGCYERCEPVELLEKLHPLLMDNPMYRLDPVRKCARVASQWEFDSFALLNSGRCYGLLWNMTRKCVLSSSCHDDGKGGSIALQIYRIRSANLFTLENLGCWRDDAFRTIPLAEGSALELTGRFSERVDALGACARYARSRGFKVFAVQAGGMCMTAEKAEENYRRFGWSEKCLKDGTGGQWSNQVWRISEDWWDHPQQWSKIPEEWKSLGRWDCSWQWWKTPIPPKQE